MSSTYADTQKTRIEGGCQATVSPKKGPTDPSEQQYIIYCNTYVKSTGNILIPTYGDFLRQIEAKAAPPAVKVEDEETEKTMRVLEMMYLKLN
ncbi:hypothetical protein CVT26_006920 [Gymnopilus dilepis]|uniref:Uncharacterized protein n=1 Tax=Gymnopilus dilepis TaxID=231916 RepID=A0A409W6S0_9AGAR|nr:hypothetical protein CVT26_006920 [Gymnopilus dilepis]